MLQLWFLRGKKKLSLPRDKSRIAYIALATFHLPQWKVCHILQLILKTFLLKTALPVKPAVAIKKNVRAGYYMANSINWRMGSWSLCVTYVSIENFMPRAGHNEMRDIWHDCNRRCHQGFKSSCFIGTTQVIVCNSKRTHWDTVGVLCLQN